MGEHFAVEVRRSREDELHVLIERELYTCERELKVSEFVEQVSASAHEGACREKYWGTYLSRDRHPEPPVAALQTSLRPNSLGSIPATSRRHSVRSRLSSSLDDLCGDSDQARCEFAA